MVPAAYMPQFVRAEPNPLAAKEEEVDTTDRVAVMLQTFRAEFRTEEGANNRSATITELAKEAQDSYKQADYQMAFDKFTRYLAACQCETHIDAENLASILSNIGACLHHMGDDEYAKVCMGQRDPVRVGLGRWGQAWGHGWGQGWVGGVGTGMGTRWWVVCVGSWMAWRQCHPSLQLFHPQMVEIL